MIQPSNGRVVLFTPAADFAGVQHDRSKPLAAHVCHVWADRCVNLMVIDSNGDRYAQTSVLLLQDDDSPPATGCYAEWMPYQKGQAAKTEAAEAAAAKS
jgi:hypothetical protein